MIILEVIDDPNHTLIIYSKKKFQNKFHLESLVIVYSSPEHPIINQSGPFDKF